MKLLDHASIPTFGVPDGVFGDPELLRQFKDNCSAVRVPERFENVHQTVLRISGRNRYAAKLGDQPFFQKVFETHVRSVVEIAKRLGWTPAGTFQRSQCKLREVKLKPSAAAKADRDRDREYVFVTGFTVKPAKDGNPDKGTEP